MTIRAPESGKDWTAVPKEYVFPCSRWFDVGQEDQKIVRELYPVESFPRGYHKGKLFKHSPKLFAVCDLFSEFHRKNIGLKFLVYRYEHR